MPVESPSCQKAVAQQLFGLYIRVAGSVIWQLTLPRETGYDVGIEKDKWRREYHLLLARNSPIFS